MFNFNPFKSAESKKIDELREQLEKAEREPTKEESDKKIREMAKGMLGVIEEQEKEMSKEEIAKKEELRKQLAELWEMDPNSSWEEIDKKTGGTI